MLGLCREHRLEHRTKHIALRYFLARELQQCGQLRLAYGASQANTADIFTKALQPCDHQRFCTMLGVDNSRRMDNGESWANRLCASASVRIAVFYGATLSCKVGTLSTCCVGRSPFCSASAAPLRNAGMRSTMLCCRWTRLTVELLVRNEGGVDDEVDGGAQVSDNNGTKQRGVIKVDGGVDRSQARVQQSTAAAGSSRADVDGRRCSPLRSGGGLSATTHVTAGGIAPTYGYFKFSPDRITNAPQQGRRDLITWRESIEPQLEVAGLKGFADGTVPILSVDDVGLRGEFHAAHLLTFMVILRCCSPVVQLALRSCRERLDADHQAWHFILSTYQVRDDLYIAQLEEKMTHIRMGEQESAMDYCNCARRILAEMRMAGAEYSTASYISHIVKGLPRGYNLMKRMMMSTMDVDEKRPTHDKGRGGGGRQQECWICHDPDHLSYECPDRADSDEDDTKGSRGRLTSRRPRQDAKPRKEKQTSKKTSSNKDVDNSGGKSRGDREASCSMVGVAEPTVSLAPEAGEDFQAVVAAVQVNLMAVLLNSSCSHHLMGTIIDMAPSNGVKHVHGFNGALQPVEGCGTVVLQGEAGKRVLTPDVLYVLGIQANLLSTGQLKESGVQLQGDGVEMLLIAATGEVLVRARYNGRVLCTDLCPCSMRSSPTEVVALRTIVSATKSTPDRLHARLAHVSVETIKSLAKHKVATGLDITPSTGADPPCVSCVRGKLAWHTFPNKGSDAEEALAVVHIDLCGPFLLLTGKKPDLMLSRVWGCMVQFMVLEQQRGGKLAPKARWGVHLGVSPESKGWEVLDLTDIKVVTLVEVIFYETLPLEVWKAKFRPASGRTQTHPPTDTSTATVPLLAEADEPADEDVVEVLPPPLVLAPPFPVADRLSSTPVSATGDEGSLEVSPVAPASGIAGGRQGAKLADQDGKPLTTGEQQTGVQSTRERPKSVGGEESTDSNVVEVPITKPELRRTGRARRPPERLSFHACLPPAAFTAEYNEIDDDLLYDDAEEDEELPELDPDMHSEGLGFESQYVHFGHPSAGGCQRSTGDPRLILGKGYRHVVLGGYGRTDPLLNKPFYPNASWKGEAVKAAMEEEIRGLGGMGTWELVERPRWVNIMKNRWVLTTKYCLDDTVEREKARLVVKGFTQVCGADYDETYSPVSSYVTLRIFLSIVGVFDLNLMHLDMKNAFLQSKLDRVLYMYQPEYFDDRTGRVDEALYFKASDDGVTCWVVVYVDDLLAASSSPTMLKELKQLLEDVFELRKISPVVKYLGLEIVRNRPAKKLWLHQQSYADKLRRRFIDKEQGGRVPKMLVSVDAYAELTFDDEEVQEHEEEEYRQKVGLLQFATMTTRPNIVFACSKLGSGLTVRSDQHWCEVNRCLAYLADTYDTALEFGGGPESLELIGYVDADDAGDKQKRMSMSGYVFVYGGAAVSWSSSCIKCATLSSTESEYVSATNAGKEGPRLRFLLAEFKLLDAGKPTILRVDNKSAIMVAAGLGLTGNLKYMEQRYAWLQHMVRRGKFVLQYIPTTEQPADFLTKALHFLAFNRCSVAIGQVRLADVGDGDDGVQE
ncbi:unnamed protein product [Closterium sp. NIES-54]